MSSHHKPSSKIRKRGLPPGTLVYTGYRAESPSNVVLLQYDAGGCIESHGYTSIKKDGILWIDVRSLNDLQTIERIGSDFRIHPLALEDVLNTQQRPKLDEYDNGIFFIAPNLKYDGQKNILVSEQISFFAGSNFVVSF